MNRNKRQYSQCICCYKVVLLLAVLIVGSCRTSSAYQSNDGMKKAPTRTGYRVVQEFNIGGAGGWDYISIDSEARRLYVSHGQQVEVLDADSGRIVGRIPDTPGVHGVAIAGDLHRGFTSNGGDKSVTIFDTRTLKPIRKVPVQGTDYILYDPFTKRVFPLNNTVTVLDAQTGDVVGTIDLGGDPEAAVSDGKGKVFVNLADKGAIAVLDPRALQVTKTYPIRNCTRPHSLSYDSANERLFVGCQPGFVSVDATNGKSVFITLACSGVDSGAFDAQNKLIFQSCGEGVVSIIAQLTPDYYRLIETVPTQLWAKTMAFDPKTKYLYLPTAEFEIIPSGDSKFPFPFQERIKPGSFKVLVVGKN